MYLDRYFVEAPLHLHQARYLSVQIILRVAKTLDLLRDESDFGIASDIEYTIPYDVIAQLFFAVLAGDVYFDFTGGVARFRIDADDPAFECKSALGVVEIP